MRFGTFVFPISCDQETDDQVIDNTLREVELAEEIGMDAVWLAEHNFDGAVAYADPVIFGAAVAMRTRRVRIGFAVVEMALHHPVRLAIQTALLDNLSQGRLTVGIGRGSGLNEYEYMGFGTTLEDGRRMLIEGEELLVKAWTGEDIRHEGEFWNVALPIVRPRPYQKPHPPLVRACVSEGSLVEMAKIGRPILMTYLTVDPLRSRLQLYRDTMLEAGFEESEVEKSLDQSWAQRGLYLAESDQEAQETASVGMQTHHDLVQGAREQYNPGGSDPRAPRPAAPTMQQGFLAGTPGTVSEQIAELRDAGLRNLMLNVNAGQLPREKVERSMRLFGEKVLPLFQKGQ